LSSHSCQGWLQPSTLAQIYLFFISKISLKEKRGQIQVQKLYTLEIFILKGVIKRDELSNALFCRADFWGG
jgi:hypothetical protein